MHAALWIVVLVATVTAVTALARRGPVPSPLLLTVVGLVASYLPGVPEVELSPSSCWWGSCRRCCTRRRSTRRWSTSGATVGRSRCCPWAWSSSTTFAVGLVAWWLLPSSPLAAAFALGAVVAPPDAVAAIGRRAPGRHAATDGDDPAGREPGQRRDRAGRAAHRHGGGRRHRLAVRGREGLRVRGRGRRRGRSGRRPRDRQGPRAGSTTRSPTPRCRSSTPVHRLPDRRGGSTARACWPSS